MKMDITIERMGKGHIINIEAHVGLQPGWQETIKDRADTIANTIATDLQRAVTKQLPAKLTRHAK